MKTKFQNSRQPNLVQKALSYADIEAILALQVKISAKIRVYDRSHVPKFKNERQLREFLDAGMIIAGVCDQDNVAGYCLLTLPDNENAELVNTYPLDDPGNVVLIQTFLLDPSYLKYDLFTKLYACAITLAAEIGRDYVVANTTKKNKRVITGLGRMGFETYAEGQNYWGEPAYFFKKTMD